MKGEKSNWKFWRKVSYDLPWQPSRAEWCKVHGINLSWYAKLERGEIKPENMTMKNFVKLARAYGLKIEDMIYQIGL